MSKADTINCTNHKNNDNYKENRHIFETDDFVSAKEIGTDHTYKFEILWDHVIVYIIFHILGLWGLALIVNGNVYLKTSIWGYYLVALSCLSITIGAHRYYTHKSFKATPLLRALLLMGMSLAGTLSMFHWCHVHRQHHRYTDTDGDPHNSKRGFFFSQAGWLLAKRHPYAKKLGRNIDMSDLQNDWMVMFQKKYWLYLFFVISVLLPVWVPVRFFGESILNSFLVSFALRYVLVVHFSNSVNSFAHLYGTRPYDKKIQPVESWFVSAITFGEGWHNYHHAFPWDYKAAELFNFNISARIIQMFEKLGLAYDLKTVSSEQVQKRILQSGDGTHYFLGDDEARAHVTAIGPLHPFNPFYNATYPPPNDLLKKPLDD